MRTPYMRTLGNALAQNYGRLGDNCDVVWFPREVCHTSFLSCGHTISDKANPEPSRRNQAANSSEGFDQILAAIGSVE